MILDAVINEMYVEIFGAASGMNDFGPDSHADPPTGGAAIAGGFRSRIQVKPFGLR
jgi:hypothetical protein